MSVHKERNALSQLFMSTSNNNAERQKKEQTAMKTKEELNAIKNEVEMRKSKLAALTDDALQQVTGGHNDHGILERIMSEIYAWLDAHPNVTKLDVYY